MNLEEKYSLITKYNKMLWGEALQPPLNEGAHVKEHPKDAIDVTIDVLKKLMPKKEKKALVVRGEIKEGKKEEIVIEAPEQGDLKVKVSEEPTSQEPEIPKTSEVLEEIQQKLKSMDVPRPKEEFLEERKDIDSGMDNSKEPNKPEENFEITQEEPIEHPEELSFEPIDNLGFEDLKKEELGTIKESLFEDEPLEKEELEFEEPEELEMEKREPSYRKNLIEKVEQRRRALEGKPAPKILTPEEAIKIKQEWEEKRAQSTEQEDTEGAKEWFSEEGIVEEEGPLFEKEEKQELREVIINESKKRELIKKILSGKPKKVPEVKNQIPTKLPLQEEEERRIPKKHRRKLDMIMDLFGQIFKRLSFKKDE